MSIITYPLNDIEYNAEEAEAHTSTKRSGIYSSEQFVATVTGQREITITGGFAWVKNGEFKGKSITVTTPEVLTVATSDGSLPRIDFLVLKFDASQNSSRFEIKQGTPSTNAVPPELIKQEDIYELGLYTIGVPAGSVEIRQSYLTDVRLDPEQCGLIQDTILGSNGYIDPEDIRGKLELIKSFTLGVGAGNTVAKVVINRDSHGNVFDLRQAFLVLPIMGVNPFVVTAYDKDGNSIEATVGGASVSGLIDFTRFAPDFIVARADICSNTLKTDNGNYYLPQSGAFFDGGISQGFGDSIRKIEITNSTSKIYTASYVTDPVIRLYGIRS